MERGGTEAGKKEIEIIKNEINRKLCHSLPSDDDSGQTAVRSALCAGGLKHAFH